MVEKTELTDGFIVLRPSGPGDIDRVYQAVRESIPEIARWLSWCHEDYDIRETRAWLAMRDGEWQQGREYDFIINDARNGLFLGECGLYRIDRENRFANLGYWVRSTGTGKGVATAATRLLVRFGFGELNLNRIEIMVATANQASLRVASKVGAVREGILRNRISVRGAVHDAVLFSLVPQDIL